jgi:hypothetical protein
MLTNATESVPSPESTQAKQSHILHVLCDDILPRVEMDCGYEFDLVTQSFFGRHGRGSQWSMLVKPNWASDLTVSSPQDD